MIPNSCSHDIHRRTAKPVILGRTEVATWHEKLGTDSQAVGRYVVYMSYM